jgi:hypothetical protein
MLQAMLRRKLTRPEEGMEDLLTSNTFGLMKYLAPEAVLLPFLRQAWDPLAGESLESALCGVSAVERYNFWPTLSQPGCASCEPDVEVILRHADGSRTWLLVEAKYRSGKSSLASEAETPPNDQLAREFDNLRSLALGEGVRRFGLVYVTADFTCPTDQMAESAAEYQAKRGEPPRLYWLSWRALPGVLESGGARELEMAKDLLVLLLDLNLTRFRRLRFEGVRAPAWRFVREAASWTWRIPALAWTFDAGVTDAGAAPGRTAGNLFEGRVFRWELASRPDRMFRWSKP